MRAILILLPFVSLASATVQILVRATREYSTQTDTRAAIVYRACVRPGAE